MIGRRDNLVFVSGPQGGGKSTLIKHLVEGIPYLISPELKTRSPQFYWGGDEKVLEDNFFHRQSLKYAQRAFENYEYLVAAKKDPNKLIIGDRCMVDSKAYRTAGVKLGWISKKEDEEIEERLRILNLDELLDPQCIILNPGFEVCKRNLEKRWKKTGWVKYKEKDMNYLRIVCDTFEEFEHQQGFLYIGEEIDYSKGEITKEVEKWVESFFTAKQSSL